MEQAIVQPEQQAPQVVNDYDIDAFIEKRTEFIEKVNKIMVEGKDFHIIQGRKSMAKGGAEKIASIFGWTATFTKDQDAMDAFSSLNNAGIICFICNLEKAGQQVGQGRGAAALAKNGGDPNKTLKMAQKSAFIDAVIRASGLSDFYTQDLENMNFGSQERDTSYEHGTTTPPQKSSYKSSSEATASPSVGVAPENANKAPTESQIWKLNQQMEFKGYKNEDLIDLGFGAIETMNRASASEAIDFLLKAKSKILPNGDPVEEPYPIIGDGDDQLPPY